MNWNLNVVEALASQRTDFGISFFSRFTELGGMGVVVIVVIVAAFVLWRGKRWAHAIGLLCALGGSIVASEIMKLVVQEARPPLPLRAIFESGFSFPSNHATASLALYGFIAWSLWDLSAPARYIGIALCGTVILLIGYSRVYLGVHYPIDIAGGYALAAVFLWVGTRITRRLERFED